MTTFRIVRIYCAPGHQSETSATTPSEDAGRVELRESLLAVPLRPGEEIRLERLENGEVDYLVRQIHPLPNMT